MLFLLNFQLFGLHLENGVLMIEEVLIDFHSLLNILPFLGLDRVVEILVAEV